eukprot:m.76845 g.76845  ORF g.76845 m.76845 type:complete len:834 (+) comp12585_c0_seq1:102-2603(+)
MTEKENKKLPDSLTISWSVEDVICVGTSCGVPQNILEKMKDYKIDGATLLHLDQDAFMEMGVVPDLIEYEDMRGHMRLMISSETPAAAETARVSFHSSVMGHDDKDEDDIGPLVTVVYEGYVIKQGSKKKTSFKRRFLKLTSDGALTYHKNETSNRCLGELHLSDAKELLGPWEADWSDLGNNVPTEATIDKRVEIFFKERKFRFFCDTKEESQKWIDSLQKTNKMVSRVRTNTRTDFARVRDQYLKRMADTKKLVPIHSGWVYKLGGRNNSWKKRFFVLAKVGLVDTLMYWKDDRCLGAALANLRIPLIEGIRAGLDCKWVDKMPGNVDEMARFQVISDSRDYKMYTDTQEEAEKWVSVLQEAVRAATPHKKVSVGVLASLEDKTLSLHADKEESSDTWQDISPTAETEEDAIAVVVNDDVYQDEDEEDNEDVDQEFSGESSSEDEDEDDAMYIDRYLNMYNLPLTNERRKLFGKAVGIGRTLKNQKRHVIIVYNPVSGSGKAKKNVENMVIPILEIAGVNFQVIATEYRGFAREFAKDFDYTRTNGLVVAGGDGLVSEVVTGLYLRSDNLIESGFPVGIVPSGTANAMANELDAYVSETYVQLIGRAALMIAEGHKRKVDLISVKGTNHTTCGLSCVGWGLAGAVALKADQLRWLPGQRHFRYDIAGFVTLMKNWPLSCKGTFEFLVESENGEEKWEAEEIQMINMIATNCPKLGVDHPICKDVRIDDGKLAVAFMDGNHTRMEAVQAAMSMKKGNYLTEHKFMRNRCVRKFRMTPSKDSTVPLLIDGDPLELEEVEIEVHQKLLTVFCPKPKRHTKAASVISEAGAATPN